MDVLMIAMEQASIDSGLWLMAAELLCEAEPAYVASVGPTAMYQFRRPMSALSDLTWAEVAYTRIRDLDDRRT